MKHMQNWIGNWTSRDLVMVVGNARLWIFELVTRVLPIVFIIERIVVINIRRRSPISSKHFVFMMFAL